MFLKSEHKICPVKIYKVSAKTTNGLDRHWVWHKRNASVCIFSGWPIIYLRLLPSLLRAIVHQT